MTEGIKRYELTLNTGVFKCEFPDGPNLGQTDAGDITDLLRLIIQQVRFVIDDETEPINSPLE